MQVQGSGSNFTVTNPSIVATDFVEITPPARYNACLIKCRTEVALYIKRKTGDTTYLTIPSGQALNLDINGDEENTFFLKSATGTVTAELLWSL